MSRGFSRVTLVGNLGSDPVTNFSLAVNRRRRGPDGQPQDEVDWYRVACFRRNAEVADQYLGKGSRVLVDGQLSIRKYIDKNSVERTSVEVSCDLFTMFGSRKDGDDGGGQTQRRQQSSKTSADDFDDVPVQRTLKSSSRWIPAGSTRG